MINNKIEITDFAQMGAQGKFILSSRNFFALFGSISIIGSFFSYTHSGLVPITLFGYGLTLISLFVIISTKRSYPKAITWRVLSFSMLFLLATLTSALSVAGSSAFSLRLVQELVYPLAALLVLLTGYPILRSSGPMLGWAILGLGMANFVVGLGGVSGALGSAGPFGSVEQGRFIFGTIFRSSNGLMLNVNYFAVTQASLGFMYALYRQTRGGRLSRSDTFFAVFLIASSVIGSSRGVTVSILAVAAFLLLTLALQKQKKGRSLFRALLVCTITLVWIGFSLYWSEIQTIFRLERGLNNRDEIWAAVILAWLERPLLGWNTESSAAIGLASAGEFAGRSAHSGFLHTLLSKGLLGFVLVYGCVVYILSRVYVRFSKSLSEVLIPIGCIVFFLVNSLFRTYSFGGIGLLPLLALLGLSVSLYKTFGVGTEILIRRKLRTGINHG